MKGQRENVWSEDLRPKKLDAIKGQPYLAVLQVFVRRKNVLDCILVGPPGVGKTTAVMALAHEIYGGIGPTEFDGCLMVLNASDERGIEVVRNQIKAFAGKAPNKDVGFLICFLDEAEGLTPEAQAALLATIETHSNNCRFIFSCNNPTNLIEGIQSRGPLIPFFKIGDEAMKEIISDVCTTKNFTIQPDALDRLVKNSNGDVRGMMKKLQMAYMLLPENKPKEITLKILNTILYEIDDSETKKLLGFLINNDIEAASASLDKLISSYRGEQILLSLERSIITCETLFPNKKAFRKTKELISNCVKENYANSTLLLDTTIIIKGLMSKMISVIHMPKKCNYIHAMK